MNDKKEATETVIRALSYMSDTWKSQLLEDELAAIEKVQSALARMVLHSIDWSE